MPNELTEAQLRVVELIAGGRARYEIADEMDLSETNVRRIIGGLCKRFDCLMRDLPEAINRGRNDDNRRPTDQ